MSWRDALIQATFRGAAFFVAGHEGGVGRRVQVHEFPLRDRPFAEDLGRKSRTFAMDAYVLGPDYMAARDALLRAVERPGAGQLEHPYLGEMRATCTACKVRESTAEGGVARFALEFVEAGDALFVAVATSTSAAVASTGAAASKSAQSHFEAKHKLAKRPQFIAQASQDIMGQALQGMASALGRVRTVTEQAAALNRDLEAAKRDLVTLVYSPASAAQALAGNLRSLIRNVTTAPRDALGLARPFYSFGSLLPPVPTTTASRRAQATNQAVMLQLVRVTAAAEGARAASQVSFESYQDAIATRDELLASMDDTMLAGPDDDTYDALRALRAAVVADIAARGADLARLVQWTPAATTPALVLAQRIYADAAREPELLQRNRVRHPLFVAGAQALEVLSNAA